MDKMAIDIKCILHAQIEFVLPKLEDLNAESEYQRHENQMLQSTM